MATIATIDSQEIPKFIQSFGVLSGFIMALKHLSYLHIAPDYHYSKCGQLEILRDKVNELILPLRPNFKFDISLFLM